MSNQPSSGKNVKFMILGLVAAVFVGLFVAKIVVENQIKERALADLSLYEPMLHLESAKAEASYLSASVTLKDIVYSMPDLPGLTLTIEKVTQEGIDRDTLMGKPGAVSTVKKVGMSNLRMLVKDKEMPVMELGYYEVADMAYPYRDVRAALLAAKGEGDPMSLFKALAPVMQGVELQSGPSLMRDFKMNLAQDGLFDFYLREITASGFKSLNKESDGYDGVLENAMYKGMKITAPLYDGSELLATLDSIEIKNFKYNYKEMLAAISRFDPEGDPFEFLTAILPSFYNYSFEAINMDGLNVAATGVVFSLESVRIGPRTLKEQGPNLASNMKFSVNGSDIFTLEAAGLDKVVLSDMLVRIIQNPAEMIRNEELQALVDENPLVLMDGFRLENLYLKNLNAPEFMNLAAWRGDAAFSADKVDIASRLDKLYISQQGLQQLAMLSLFFGGASMRDAINFMAMNSEGMTLDSSFDLDMGVQPGRLDYDLKFDLSEKLGALAFALQGETGPAGPYEAYGAPMLWFMKLRLSDSGILENVFSALAKDGMAEDAAGVRKLLAEELQAEMATAKPGELRLLRGLQTFIRQGGTVIFSLKPKQPIPLEEADIFDGGEELNIEVENIQ